MDIGLMAVLIALILYNGYQYSKDKKQIYLINMLFFSACAIYGTKYPIYNYLQQPEQRIVDISFGIFIITLLSIGFANRFKKKHKVKL